MNFVVLDRRGGTNRAMRTLVSAEVEAGVTRVNALRAGRGRSQSAHRLLHALAVVQRTPRPTTVFVTRASNRRTQNTYSPIAAVTTPLTVKLVSGAADAQDPLLPLMGFGLPDMAQIVYKLSITPSSAKSSGSSGNAVSNPKGPTTHYTLDFGVSLNQIKLDVQPDGSRRAQLEVKAVAYDDAGKPLNVAGQRGLLNITPGGFQEAQKSGVHFEETRSPFQYRHPPSHWCLRPELRKCRNSGLESAHSS